VTIHDRVDIGMPILNGEKTVKRALESLLNQSHENIHIHISDNGSSDRTLELIQQAAQADARITVYEGEKGSSADNFRFVLNSSSSNFFMWAADDDKWHPDFIRVGLEKLLAGFDYFTPNWWVGDIDTNRGFNTVVHPLEFIEQGDSTSRLLNFLNLHHLSHKCNLVYSLFKTQQLKACLETQSIDNDGALAALIVHRLLGKCDNQLFFWKEGHDWRSAGKIKRAKIRIKTSLVSLLAGKGHAGKSFEEVKRTALERLVTLFPEFPNTLNFLFSQYQRWPKDDTMRICSSYSDLRDLAAFEINERDDRGLATYE